jgi:hypothetical protein
LKITTEEANQLSNVFVGQHECIVVNNNICPHKEINGKLCTYCNLPDLYYLELNNIRNTNFKKEKVS